MDLFYNSAARSALKILRDLSVEQRNLHTSVTTGADINGPRDNAAYWSIATEMRGTSKTTTAVVDALSLGAALVDVTYTALESMIDIASEIKSKVILSKGVEVDRYKTSVEILSLQKQFLSVATSATFNGVNLLAPGGLDYTVKDYVDGNGKTLQYIEMASTTSSTAFAGVLSSYNDGRVDMMNIYGNTNYNLFGNASYLNKNGTTSTQAGLIGNPQVDGETDGVAHDDPAKTTAFLPAFNGRTQIAFANGSDTDDMYSAAHLGEIPDDLLGYATDLLVTRYDDIAETLTARAAALGTLRARIDIQLDFNETLKKTLDKGVGRLVDTEMNGAAVKLKAVQTQQQLTLQALSIANTAPSNLMQLFQ